MIGKLCCFSFLAQLENIILTAVIAIAIIVCITIMIRNKNSRKLMYYILGSIVIGVGVLSSVSLVKEMTRTSYVVGSIDIGKTQSQESFKYYASNITFYETENTNEYVFEIDLLKVDSFDGTNNEYEVYLNNYELFDNDIQAGAIYSTIEMEFKGTDGSLISNPVLDLSIKFLSSKTELSLCTTGSENASFLEQYFDDYGFKLEVKQIEGGN